MIFPSLVSARRLQAALWAPVFASFFLTAPAVADPLDTWFVRSPGVGASAVGSVAYGNGTFVATEGYSVSTSNDGTNWQNSFVYPGFNFVAISFGGGAFYAVLQQQVMTNYSYYVAKSLDGLNWNLLYQTPSALSAVAMGNGKVVAVGQNAIASASLDDMVWTEFKPAAALEYVAFGIGRFVAVGGSTWQGADWYYRDSGWIFSSGDFQ